LEVYAGAEVGPFVVAETLLEVGTESGDEGKGCPIAFESKAFLSVLVTDAGL
jgi:hypothetical protein